MNNRMQELETLKNDYSDGVHPKILSALSKLSDYTGPGYGLDSLCYEASELIKKLIKNDQSEVLFISGGTQANLICLASILKPYESIISVASGHILHNEAGAIELTGHKINAVAGKNGKVLPHEIEQVVSEHSSEHMVFPKVVYISNATELGSIYQKDEIEALYNVCQKHNLLLYMDGARLASALTSKISDINIDELSSFLDIFYIGGTKNGLLFGEAIVINNNDLQNKFRYHMKQRGALMAKGYALGAQFVELFKTGLYFEMAEHANNMAHQLAVGIKKSGYEFIEQPSSNQIFPIIPNTIIKKLQLSFDFYVWQKYSEDSSVIRLVTSWNTKSSTIENFLAKLN